MLNIQQFMRLKMKVCIELADEIKKQTLSSQFEMVTPEWIIGIESTVWAVCKCSNNIWSRVPGC